MEKNEFRCINCEKALQEQEGFDPSLREWFCTECGELNLLPVNKSWSIEEDERQRKEAAEAYFQKKSNERAVLREENAKRREAERIENEKKEEEQKKQLEERRNQRFNVIKKYSKVGVISLIIITIIIVASCTLIHFRKLTSIGVDSDTLISMQCDDVVSLLSNNGFTKISAVPIEDLTADDADKELTVVYVDINGTTTFDSTQQFSCDEKITIYYHILMEIPTPVSAKQMKGNTIEEVEALLCDAGFINITKTPLQDVKLGLFVKENEVKSVSIDGNSKFKIGDKFRPDAEIIIEYHSKK